MLNTFQMFGVFLIVVGVVVFLFDRITDGIPVLGWIDNFILIPMTLILIGFGSALVLFGQVIEKAIVALAIVGVGVFLFQIRSKSSGGKG